MNTVSVRDDLRGNFKDSKEYREAFVEEHVYTTVAFQTRALREKRNWSQKRLGRNAQMAQERISILEDPNSETKPTLNTLVRLAAAFDVGLEVRFVPFGRVLDTSFENDPDSLNVPSFEDDPAFKEAAFAVSSGADSATIHGLTGLATEDLSLYIGPNTNRFLAQWPERHAYGTLLQVMPGAVQNKTEIVGTTLNYRVLLSRALAKLPEPVLAKAC